MLVHTPEQMAQEIARHTREVEALAATAAGEETDPDKAYEDAYNAGMSYAAALLGALKGFADGIVDTLGYEPPTPNDVDIETQADEDERATPKDCRRCWCNTCAKLDECGKMLGAGDLTLADVDAARAAGWPDPCIGCKKGMRRLPIEEHACEDYERGEGENYG